MEKCPKCEHKYAKYPAFELKTDGTIDYKKPIIKNWFRVDFMSAMFFILIIVMTVSYRHDIDQFIPIMNDTCGYCAKQHCGLSIIAPEQSTPFQPDLQNVPNLNLVKNLSSP